MRTSERRVVVPLTHSIYWLLHKSPWIPRLLSPPSVLGYQPKPPKLPFLFSRFASGQSPSSSTMALDQYTYVFVIGTFFAMLDAYNNGASKLNLRSLFMFLHGNVSHRKKS